MSNSIAYVLGSIPDAENRERDDFYPTPPEGTRALLSVEQFHGPIWEPACGDGAISRTLIEAGHEVVSSDLIDRGYGETGIDFLMEWRPRAPNIITNPPFKHAEQFVRHSLALTTGKVAMLCRLAWLEGKERRQLFESTPLARVWVFAGRLKIQRGRLMSQKETAGMIAFAWFVWEHGHQGRPTIGWVTP